MRKKKIITITAAVFIAAAIGAIALAALVYFCSPMKDLSYDLSLSAPDGTADPLPDKGWTIFTDNCGKRKELTGNGFGAYKGLDYLGQTFYASRMQITESVIWNCQCLTTTA